MLPRSICLMVIVAALLGVVSPNAFATLSNPNAPQFTGEAIRRVADRLVAEQVIDGPFEGAWPAKEGVPAGSFTGSMAAGLAEAYRMTCDNDYKEAAKAAGEWIWNNAPHCAIYFDEAYAFMKLSQISCDPTDNQWRTALEDFYNCIELQGPDPAYDNKAGTELYIAMIEEGLLEPFAVIEVAYYTVAAYYIDTPEKVIWRDGLVSLLEAANADSGEQIFALGVATWALALTGDLDSTGISVGSSSWGGLSGGLALELAELPDLLATYQIPEGNGVYSHHFYAVYNPSQIEYSGWTETNIFAVIGLNAATGDDFRSQIDNAWAVNMQPVDINGDVWYDSIDSPGVGDNATYYHYAGEYLQYLSAVRLPGDLNLDDLVDKGDVEILATNWLQISGCECSIADMNGDHEVNLFDLANLAQGWNMSR